MTLRAGGLFVVLSFCFALGCSSDIEIGQNLRNTPIPPLGGSGGMAGAPTGGSAGTAGGAGDCQVSSCQGAVYACGNCEDDDADGFVDSDDSHCTGPCDDNEASFAIDIRNGTGPPCKQDCFFDGDIGSGNDGCNWSHRCDQRSVDPGYPPSGDPLCAYDEDAPIPGMSASCEDVRLMQDPMCAATCGPLVPNGCDCFGCCELPAGSNLFVWLGSQSDNPTGCTEETLGNETLCKPCTQVRSCLNDCDPCEICVGRPAPDPSCGSGAPPPCPTGMAACGPDGPRCGERSYCITGCCVPEPG